MNINEQVRIDGARNIVHVTDVLAEIVTYDGEVVVYEGDVVTYEE